MTNVRYDAVVIGAGHNGLTAATLLAAKGRHVLVVEAREAIGGLAAGVEFHPGYRHAGILDDTSCVRPWAVKALGLDRFGLTRREVPALLVPESGGPGLVLEATASGSDGLSAIDATSFARYQAFLARIAPRVAAFLDHPPIDLAATEAGQLLRLGFAGLSLRRLGRRDLTEVLRIAPMPVADWLGEWFESDLLQAALAGPAVYSTYSGPRSPGSSANLLLSAVRSDRPIAGGAPALVSALEGAARARGVEIRTGVAVERLVADGDRVTGVELAGGERLIAAVVAASCDPRQLFLDLLPPAALSRMFEADVLAFRARGTAAKIHFALSEYPHFASRPGRIFEHVRIGQAPDEIERAFDAVKYRRFSQRPVLDIRFPTVETPELAPDGHHVASILVSFAPFDLEGGWTDTARNDLYRAVLSVLENHAPGLEKLIVGCEVSTPADLAERYRLTQGHLFHGEHALDQLLVRPTPQCSEYATPLAGLYLCGSGSHPGGGLTCAPGALAARAIRSNEM